MFRQPIKEINAEFIAEEKYLDSIQRTVKESCIAASMSKKEISSVMLAVEEAATNIIRHAYLYEKGILRLRIVIYKKLVVFSLIDFGRSFQPDSSGKLDLDQLVDTGRKGGLGFYMIKKIMDSVEYISTASFNELRMIKRRKDSSAPGRQYLRRMFTLRVKFSVWTFIIMTIITGASIYYFDYKITNLMFDNAEETINALGKTIADQSAGYFLNNRSDVEFDQLIVSYKRANPELKQIVLTDFNNIIRAHSDDILKIRKVYRPTNQIEYFEYNKAQSLIVNDSLVYKIVMPILTGQRELGMVYLTYTTSHVSERLSDIHFRILLLTLFLALLGILGIYMLSNYFVTPILKITHRVRRYTSGDLETELPLEGAEEFFEISKAFNQMLTRLSQDRKNLVEREKMAKEIEMASEIQQTLMPKDLPKIPNLEVESFYRAASLVGGDLFDVFAIDDNRYCLTVADVSGKGVPASLVMSMLRTVIQVYAAKGKSARETLVTVNEYLEKNIPPGIFVTLFLVIYNISEKNIQFVSAGHNPMIFYNAAKKNIIKINPKGMPLGLPVNQGLSFKDAMEEFSHPFEENDLFFLFTDGITEATNREGEQFGMKRIEKIFEENIVNNESPDIKELGQIIMNEIDDFTGFAKAQDDITFVIAHSIFDEAEQKEQDENANMNNTPSKIDVQNIESPPDKAPKENK